MSCEAVGWQKKKVVLLFPSFSPGPKKSKKANKRKEQEHVNRSQCRRPGDLRLICDWFATEFTAKDDDTVFGHTQPSGGTESTAGCSEFTASFGDAKFATNDGHSGVTTGAGGEADSCAGGAPPISKAIGIFREGAYVPFLCTHCTIQNSKCVPLGQACQQSLYGRQEIGAASVAG